MEKSKTIPQQQWNEEVEFDVDLDFIIELRHYQKMVVQFPDDQDPKYDFIFNEDF